MHPVVHRKEAKHYEHLPVHGLMPCGVAIATLSSMATTAITSPFLLLPSAGTSTTGPVATTASDQAGKQSTAPAQVLELDADELLTYKRRLLDFLQPQETVLAALRRLGGLQGTLHAGSDDLPWKRSRKAAGMQPCIDRPLWCYAYA